MTRLEKKRSRIHKVKMHLSVYAILLLATLGSIVAGKVHSRELDLQLQTKQVYAFAPTPHYQIPSLNPNESEREQNIVLIKKIWGKDAKLGLEIARCESGYRTHAENKNKNLTLDQGIFQINSIHEMPEMENAVANISYAYIIYQEQGTTPWNSSKECWY